jgi:hypothetical protein
MAQADAVPSAIRASITGARSNPPTKRVLTIGRYFFDQANADPMPVWALGYATAVVLLGWFPWNVLLILLLFVGREKSHDPLRPTGPSSVRRTVRSGGSV